MKLLSELYDVTLKRGTEGAAKGGFIFGDVVICGYQYLANQCQSLNTNKKE